MADEETNVVSLRVKAVKLKEEGVLSGTLSAGNTFTLMVGGVLTASDVDYIIKQLNNLKSIISQ